MELIVDILRCFIHGFKAKTGAEPWLIKHYEQERASEKKKITKLLIKEFVRLGGK